MKPSLYSNTKDLEVNNIKWVFHYRDKYDEQYSCTLKTCTYYQHRFVHTEQIIWAKAKNNLVLQIKRFTYSYYLYYTMIN